LLKEMKRWWTQHRNCNLLQSVLSSNGHEAQLYSSLSDVLIYWSKVRLNNELAGGAEKYVALAMST
jgi:hypothetical protein